MEDRLGPAFTSAAERTPERREWTHPRDVLPDKVIDRDPLLTRELPLRTGALSAIQPPTNNLPLPPEQTHEVVTAIVAALTDAVVRFGPHHYGDLLLELPERGLDANNVVVGHLGRREGLAHRVEPLGELLNVGANRHRLGDVVSIAPRVHDRTIVGLVEHRRGVPGCACASSHASARSATPRYAGAQHHGATSPSDRRDRSQPDEVGCGAILSRGRNARGQGE